ncbi:erythromycin esterase family protein [Motilimonas sp. 1_MG-2023]|uniref:erythromycin esterase family protein n=1 Tax=Motilimonas sp. 1_MG-2023 TaxID=3062672 RepID=UPI0026E25C06|nr:erythromycin esterase family protein [Motilimonas sp. 1_MG-2023]MDO6527267.1 erythromycin esterase family protein [Motilimonas sp. 1_MG-2023]
MKCKLMLLSSAIVLAACGGGGGGNATSTLTEIAGLEYSEITSTQMSSDNTDIKPIIDRVKDYDLVSLGEPSHNGSVVHFIKSRILQGLHQEGKLDLVVFEAGFYDGLVAWEQYLTGKQPLIEAITGPHANFMYMQRHSKGVSQIVNYINDLDQVNSPLILAGFDSRINSDPACLVKEGDVTSIMLQELDQYLTDSSLSVDNLMDVYTIAPVMMCSWHNPDVTYNHNQALHQQLMSALVALEKVLEQQAKLEVIPEYDPTTPRNFRQYASFWLQVVKGMQGHAQMQVNDLDYAKADVRSADNLRWLRDVWFKTRGQTAIWSHNIHITKVEHTVPQALVKQQPELTSYVMGVIDNGGMYAPYVPQYETWAEDAFAISRDKDTVNYLLGSAGIPNAFIDFNETNSSNLIFSGKFKLAFHGGAAQYVTPAEIMDGMLFIPVEEATVSRY